MKPLHQDIATRQFGVFVISKVDCDRYQPIDQSSGDVSFEPGYQAPVVDTGLALPPKVKEELGQALKEIANAIIACKKL